MSLSLSLSLSLFHTLREEKLVRRERNTKKMTDFYFLAYSHSGEYVQCEGLRFLCSRTGLQYIAFCKMEYSGIKCLCGFCCFKLPLLKPEVGFTLLQQNLGADCRGIYFCNRNGDSVEAIVADWMRDGPFISYGKLA
jgi:hypothetical protein